jgi:HSP20 family protein
MTLVRYQQPWALHRELLQEVNRLFDRAGENDPSTGATADWSPAVDIDEYADRFVLRADVPGIDPASIEVTLEKGVLTLSGTREQPVESNGVERRRVERAAGRFHRRFTLPDTVDSESVSASNRHGVLEVVIPKRPQVQPRKIAVTH